jgi:hypothetical protein
MSTLRSHGVVSRLIELLGRKPAAHDSPAGQPDSQQPDQDTSHTCEVCSTAGVTRRGAWDYCPRGHVYVGVRTEEQPTPATAPDADLLARALQQTGHPSPAHPEPPRR